MMHNTSFGFWCELMKYVDQVDEVDQVDQVYQVYLHVTRIR